MVDLDCTIIHATVDPTVGEWKNDPHCINYNSVKDVQSFQLQDSVAGGHGTWYYVKLRPGLQEFLEHIAKLYELHIYTMGTRAYAMSIKKIVDPDGRFFGDRVLSRDENGNMSQKSLHKLFPVDTKMVVIIDDRGDVWKWCDNLVKVRPYDFFIGIGDINSSFLPKQQTFPPASPASQTIAPPILEAVQDTKEEKEAKLSVEASPPVVDEIPETVESPQTPDATSESGLETLPIATSVTQLSALEQLITTSDGENRRVLPDETDELDKALAAQKEHRPLARKQELQDRLDEKAAEEALTVENGDNNEDTASEGRQKHSVLQDNDTELPPLKQHLSAIHDTFYEEYDKNKGKRCDRVSQLKRPKRKRIVEQDSEDLDLSAVPDVAYIMPKMKRQALEGTVIVFSGVIPLGSDVQSSDIAVWSKSFGATVAETLSSKVTHVIAARSRTAKVRQAATRYSHIKIVSPEWLYATISLWKRVPEEVYLVAIHPEDRAPTDGDLSNPLLSSEDDDDSDNDDMLDVSEQEGIDKVELDWADVESELKEFMEDEYIDGDSDSASDSDISTSTNISAERRPKKRYRSGSPASPADGDTAQPALTADDGPDATSRLAKRQRVARERGGSQLKLAESAEERVEPADASSGGVSDDEAVDNPQAEESFEVDDDLAADLERELMAAMEDEGPERDGGDENDSLSRNEDEGTS